MDNIKSAQYEGKQNGKLTLCTRNRDDRETRINLNVPEKNRHATASGWHRDTSYSGFLLEGKQRLVESMALSRQWKVLRNDQRGKPSWRNTKKLHCLYRMFQAELKYVLIWNSKRNGRF
jgi:hypothetical protein